MSAAVYQRRISLHNISLHRPDHFQLPVPILVATVSGSYSFQARIQQYGTPFLIAPHCAMTPLGHFFSIGSNPAVWKPLYPLGILFNRFKSSSMETSVRHIVTLALASCALQLNHLAPRPAVFSFDNLAIPNGVHSLVVDAPRFFHSIECGIFFQYYTRPRCCCTCTGCAGSPGCVPVLGQPHFASPFVRSHSFSVAPQHSDFTLQHHFSCAVKSDFNESRSSGQYFDCANAWGVIVRVHRSWCNHLHCDPLEHATDPGDLLHAPAAYSLSAVDRATFSALGCGKRLCSSKFHNTTGLRPASIIGRACLCQQNLHLTMSRAENHAPCQNVSSLPAVLFNLALSHFSQPLHSASS